MKLAPMRRRLPARLAPVAFSLYMSALAALMMSLVLTAIHTGVDARYLERVLRAYVAAWPVGFVGVMLARPLVVRLVELTVAGPSKH